jgi:hypothetical protein
VLKGDDSSLQYSDPGGGLTGDLDKELEYLFDRFVLRNEPHGNRECREHDEVWRTFRQCFEEEKVLAKLKPVRIVGASFEYEFEHAWKNDKWHPLQAVSMDAVDAHTLQDRAVSWVGRAMDLSSDKQLGTLYMLIGPPQVESLKTPYSKAIDLLHRMPIRHEIIKEDEAADFARQFGRMVAAHGTEADEK